MFKDSNRLEINVWGFTLGLDVRAPGRICGRRASSRYGCRVCDVVTHVAGGSDADLGHRGRRAHRHVRFVDTDVFMYAIGAPHPDRAAARAMLEEGADHRLELCTSAEVLQELLHVYLPSVDARLAAAFRRV